MSFLWVCAAAFSFIHSFGSFILSFKQSGYCLFASLRHNRQHINRELCVHVFSLAIVCGCWRNSDPMSMLSLAVQKLSTIQTWIITICFAMIITQQIENFTHTHNNGIFILSHKIHWSCCVYPCPSWNDVICVSAHFCATIFDKHLFG